MQASTLGGASRACSSVVGQEPLPASGPLCADRGSLRVRRFSRRLRIQTAATRCASAVRGPPAHEGWRTPLKHSPKCILKQVTLNYYFNICFFSSRASASYLATFHALVGATWLEMRVHEVTLRLHFRVTGVLFYIHIEVFSGPPVADLMSR